MSLMARLTDQHCVITGAGSGIGLAISQRFASEGGIVHLWDVNQDAVEQAAAGIVAQGGRAHAAVCDVADEAAVTTLMNGLERLDVLVNNAGVGHIGTAESTTAADMEKLWRINVLGVWHGIKAALPKFRQQGRGVILNMCSIAAEVGLEARFAYSTTKGAIYAMTLQVARDYISQGIRCNCLCPARVHTPFVDAYLARNYPGQEQEMFAQLSAAQPIGRMGSPEEIALAAAFVCSADAAFMTGTALDIDGGAVRLR
jgi:2-keto-3-deoxy-L-fuconate dehydrogenase